MIRPLVTYFVESREEAARAGFPVRADFLLARVVTPEVVELLRQDAAAVAVACYPGEHRMEEVLARLISAGVAVDVWVTLDRAHGYWQCRSNVAQTEAGVCRIAAWLDRSRLPVRAVGFDLEPHRALVEAAFAHSPRRIARELMRVKRDSDAQKRFDRLVRDLAERMAVHLYVLPLVPDVPGLGWVLGTLAVPPGFLSSERNRVVRMLYTSLAPFGRGSFVARHLRQGLVPALGVVGAESADPGVSLRPDGAGGRPHLLSPAELLRDVAAVVRWWRATASPAELHVFALNGPGVITAVRAAMGRALAAPE